MNEDIIKEISEELNIKSEQAMTVLKEGAIENFTAVIHFKKEGNSWIISKEEFE